VDFLIAEETTTDEVPKSVIPEPPSNATTKWHGPMFLHPFQRQPLTSHDQWHVRCGFEGADLAEMAMIAWRSCCPHFFAVEG